MRFPSRHYKNAVTERKIIWLANWNEAFDGCRTRIHPIHQWHSDGPLCKTRRHHWLDICQRKASKPHRRGHSSISRAHNVPHGSCSITNSSVSSTKGVVETSHFYLANRTTISMQAGVWDKILRTRSLRSCKFSWTDFNFRPLRLVTVQPELTSTLGVPVSLVFEVTATWTVTF